MISFSTIQAAFLPSSNAVVNSGNASTNESFKAEMKIRSPAASGQIWTVTHSKSANIFVVDESSSGTVKPIQLRIQKDPPVAPDTSQTFDKELPSSKSSSVKNKENSGEGVSRSERLKSKPTPVAPEFQVWPLSTAFSHNFPFFGSDRNILMTPTG